MVCQVCSSNWWKFQRRCIYIYWNGIIREVVLFTFLQHYMKNSIQMKPTCMHNRLNYSCTIGSSDACCLGVGVFRSWNAGGGCCSFALNFFIVPRNDKLDISLQWAINSGSKEKTAWYFFFSNIHWWKPPRVPYVAYFNPKIVVETSKFKMVRKVTSYFIIQSLERPNVGIYNNIYISITLILQEMAYT